MYTFEPFVHCEPKEYEVKWYAISIYEYLSENLKYYNTSIVPTYKFGSRVKAVYFPKLFKYFHEVCKEHKVKVNTYLRDRRSLERKVLTFSFSYSIGDKQPEINILSNKEEE